MRIRKATVKDKGPVKSLDNGNMGPIIKSPGREYKEGVFDFFNPKNCFIIGENMNFTENKFQSHWRG